VNPKTNQTALVGSDLGTESRKYDSACFVNGYVYAAPLGASQALRVRIFSEGEELETQPIQGMNRGSSFKENFRRKWHRSVEDLKQQQVNSRLT